MSHPIPPRLAALRQAMAAHNVAACLVPTADPHLSEYLPDHWAAREWLSGFTGSAGTLLVTQTHAGLWTDSRYFAQAEPEELLIDEVEAIWAAVSEADDWSLFNAKVDRLRVAGNAWALT